MSATMQRTDPADLAAHSLALYQELRDELQRMPSEIGAAETERILAVDESMTRLRQAIQKVDAALMASLRQPEAGEDHSADHLADLLTKRRQVMTEVLSLNEEMIAQAESIKSLLGHDLAAMRAGRQVLRGYAPPGEGDSGGIINRQF